jgi:hypothetical protein
MQANSSLASQSIPMNKNLGRFAVTQNNFYDSKNQFNLKNSKIPNLQAQNNHDVNIRESIR